MSAKSGKLSQEVERAHPDDVENLSPREDEEDGEDLEVVSVESDEVDSVEPYLKAKKGEASPHAKKSRSPKNSPNVAETKAKADEIAVNESVATVPAPQLKGDLAVVSFDKDEAPPAAAAAAVAAAVVKVEDVKLQSFETMMSGVRNIVPEEKTESKSNRNLVPESVSEVKMKSRVPESAPELKSNRNLVPESVPVSLPEMKSEKNMAVEVKMRNKEPESVATAAHENVTEDGVGTPNTEDTIYDNKEIFPSVAEIKFQSSVGSETDSVVDTIPLSSARVRVKSSERIDEAVITKDSGKGDEEDDEDGNDENDPEFDSVDDEDFDDADDKPKVSAATTEENSRTPPYDDVLSSPRSTDDLGSPRSVDDLKLTPEEVLALTINDDDIDETLRNEFDSEKAKESQIARQLSR